MPASGHIGQLCNVSAVVLPEPMPVPEDGQMPMFSDDPRVLRDIAREQHETARLQRKTAKLLARLLASGLYLAAGARTDGAALPDPSTTLSPQEETTNERRPRNADHRTWRGFVLSMQKLERAAIHGELKLTKQAICQLGPDSAKTVTRTMTEVYGLDSDDWPPSRWDPDRPPTKGVSGDRRET